MIPTGRYRSFDSVAADYDSSRVIPDDRLDAVARIIAEVSGMKRGGIFLDAGVGTGRFAVPLARMAPGRVVGVDISNAMMSKIGPKDPNRHLRLISGDLRRLPIGSRKVRGALAVHIVHLIEDWKTVLDELYRALEPGGVILLGSEQGGRSVLTDFYYERARARRALTAHIGGTSTAAAGYLRRPSREGRPAGTVEMVPTPSLSWKRTVPISTTLELLERSTFSQMWDVPQATHGEVMRETEEYARRTFGKLDRNEVLTAQFGLQAVRWP